MPLIQRMMKVCEDLSKFGWNEFLKTVAGLDIQQATPSALARELSRPLDPIDRQFPGFADFALEGSRAIEPGKPSWSLLFHALASPGLGKGCVDRMPTREQIETVEDYVYGVKAPSIAELRVRAGGAPLAMAVFASEYRPASQTVHQKHADMCYSRTGIARLGNRGPHYHSSARGYNSFTTGHSGIRVVPCRFSLYIAAHLPGDAGNFGPMRFRGPGTVSTMGSHLAPDSERLFWVPIHKLFDGAECIRDLDEELNIVFSSDFRNEKLRRLHLYLKSQGVDTGYDEPELSDYPFVIGARELVRVKGQTSSCWVMPIPHPLAEEARLPDNRRVGFPVPPGGVPSYGAFKVPPTAGGGRPAPELVYVRQAIDPSTGDLEDLNQHPNLLQILVGGGFRAQHYVDYAADGWVKADCEQLALELPRTLPAYSILAPPDFYPIVKQQDVLDWWRQSVPPDVAAFLFLDGTGPIPPEPLSDCRLTANISFRSPITWGKSTPIFDSSDDTYPTIVSAFGAGKAEPTMLRVFNDERVSPLGDGASGLFAPGWDISRAEDEDENSNGTILHLAGYGGSSPFLEDIRLCSAQSAFWPAMEPDTARLYEPGSYPSVTPIPQRLLGWDGLEAPLLSKSSAMFYNIAYTDYVRRALPGGPGFDFTRIGKVDAKHYEMWSLVMARVYQTLGLTKSNDKAKWALVYFNEAGADDEEKKLLVAAEVCTQRRLMRSYHFVLVRPSGRRPSTTDPSRVEVDFDRRFIAFATPHCVLYNDSFMPGWHSRDF